MTDISIDTTQFERYVTDVFVPQVRRAFDPLGYDVGESVDSAGTLSAVSVTADASALGRGNAAMTAEVEQMVPWLAADVAQFGALVAGGVVDAAQVVVDGQARIRSLLGDQSGADGGVVSGTLTGAVGLDLNGDGVPDIYVTPTQVQALQAWVQQQTQLAPQAGSQAGSEITIAGGMDPAFAGVAATVDGTAGSAGIVTVGGTVEDDRPASAQAGTIYLSGGTDPAFQGVLDVVNGTATAGSTAMLSVADPQTLAVVAAAVDFANRPEAGGYQVGVNGAGPAFGGSYSGGSADVLSNLQDNLNASAEAGNMNDL